MSSITTHSEYCKKIELEFVTNEIRDNIIWEIYKCKNCNTITKIPKQQLYSSDMI